MHHDLDVDVILIHTGEYRVHLRHPFAGEAARTVRWPWSELELENRLKDLQIALLRAGGRRRKALSPEEETVQRFGRELFALLFDGETLAHYRRSIDLAGDAHADLRIRLHLDDPALAALPWEFLYDATHGDYLCLSTRTPIVRYLDVGRLVAPLTVTAPLRVLGVIASPSDLEPLDVEAEKARVEQALANLIDAGMVELVWMRGQTWRDLLRSMRAGPWHVVHFIGHGGFDPHRDEGLICFADDAGQTRAMAASDVALLLADHHDLRLVLLNACESARAGALDIFSSTATALVRRGLPAVIAMQYEITDRAAIEFARSLYEALAEGMSIDGAVSEARKAVKLDAPYSMEWGTPVLHLRAADGRLFEIETPKPALPPATPALPPAAPSAQPAAHAAQTRTPPASQSVQTPPAAAKAPAVVKRSLDPEVARALAILTDWEHYPPEERLKAGDFLGAAPGRDPRPGVGLRTDGLPDIDWVEIPECDANGRREFIYQKNERRTEPTFWIARYPITYEQFQVFVDARDGFQNKAWREGLASFPDLPQQYFKVWNRPRERVYWVHAVAFGRWLTARAQQTPDLLPQALRKGKGGRITLPTEWQWAKAARGWDDRRYPWGAEYRTGYANVDETEKKDGPHTLQQTSAVGMYPQGASPFDVLDLSGNVWEYCLNEYSKPQNVQESGQARRAVLGGSWYSSAGGASVAARLDVVGSFDGFGGFRVVCAASP
ncbi:MAG: SUMF1/EgtB/PvdO family nonheme iron enzyme [Anaerolineales bacterium]|nr:SUMF1/EgtB/PvdO family nonheme iron enzyme [Anaerolineales bacterium]